MNSFLSTLYSSSRPHPAAKQWLVRLVGITCTAWWVFSPTNGWATPVNTGGNHEFSSSALDSVPFPQTEPMPTVINSISPLTNAIEETSRLFPDFRGTGRPGNHGSGASRGFCPAIENTPPLTLLVPEEAKYGGYTTQAAPTLWAYIPYVLNEDSPITFSLLDGNGNTIYEVFQVINHEPGILRLALPDRITLDVGQTYEWYLMLHCNDPERKDVASFASGWIERITDPIGDEMTEGSLVEQSNAYANQLIWYDALTILGEGLLADPNNSQVIDAWTDLLSLPSVKLDVISTEPIRECCLLPEQPSLSDY